MEGADEMWPELLCLWTICGIIAAYIYQNKGRPVLYGCLVGFGLGPLGIVYAAVRSTRQDKIEKNLLKQGKMKKCPYCGELVRPEALVCPHCHRDI